jgi:preprotein translocase subunit SecD
MVNRFPLWKNLLIILAIVVAALYAAPNLYPNDPAVQITHESGSLTQDAIDVATLALADEGISIKEVESDDATALIRLLEQDDQSQAQMIIDSSLPDGYIVALNQAPTTPGWLRSIGARPMTLGLDLSGGVHFLMEVDMEKAVSNRLTDTMAALRTLLREENLRYRVAPELDEDNQIIIAFSEEEVRDEARVVVREEYPDMQIRSDQRGRDYLLTLSYTELSILELQDYALQQNLVTLRTRINELGVREASVAPMGVNRISIELPGIQDTARAKELISAVASLQFHLAADSDTPRTSTEQYEYQGSFAEIDTDIVVAGENVTNAQSTYDQNGLPQVAITLDSPGARQMSEATRGNIGRMLGILLIETKVVTELVRGPDGAMIEEEVPVEERRMISWARINDALGKQFVITGLEPKEANDLALLIRSGALAAPMYFLEESTVGPSLGQDNIDRGVTSVKIGLAAVLIFMVVWYRVCGIAANIALAVNLVLLVAMMSIIGATLTMPGIAGIVLTVGMAVDANVLIFARIREELKNGASVQQAIDGGFNRAFTTILDANVTTLLVAIILYSIGTGPVEGFAVTLTFGIICSMFTAIVVTRAMINLMYGGRNVKSISIGLRLPPKTAQETSTATS